MKIKIPFGKEEIQLDLPRKNILGIFEANAEINAKKIKISFKINKNLNSKKVLIVVPDKTRQSHLKEILPILIRELKRQGAQEKNTKIIIALGLHEPHSSSEIEDLIGNLGSVEVINHQRKLVKYFGKTTLGVPIYLSKHLSDADYIVTIGLVEPHLYAGFSGGPKTVAIGLAGEKTISATHNLNFLSRNGVALGKIESNPFAETLAEISKKVPIDFVINMVNNEKGDLIALFSGNMAEVFEKAVKLSTQKSFQKVASRADVVIAGIGYPKDVNLYQATRAFNYILNVENSIIKKGGKVIIFAELADGIGKGLGEKRFYKSLQNGLKEIKNQAGDHRGFMVKKALAKAELILISKNAKLFKETPIKIIPEFSLSLINKNDKVYIIKKSLSKILSAKSSTES